MSSFRQLFDQRKNAKKLPIVFSAFFLWKLWKKSCLNEFKFWEASRNQKSSLSWKFHNSILKNAKESQLSASIPEKVVPLYEIHRNIEAWNFWSLALLTNEEQEQDLVFVFLFNTRTFTKSIFIISRWCQDFFWNQMPRQ